MNIIHDPRLTEAKLIPTSEVVDRIGISGLKPQGVELVGPCPLCGGRDRFAINLRSGAFLCRQCDIKGGDQVSLVQQVQGVDFKAALAFLCGDAPAEIDATALAARQRAAALAKEKQDRDADRFRAKAVADARWIWRAAEPYERTALAAYLGVRGIPPAMIDPLPKALRFLPDHVYRRKASGSIITHRGPAMIAVIQGPDGKGAAVHQTWLDLDQPGGKARIEHEGEAMPAKLVRGSKKGGAIRLITPEGADTLVMGEGIETTLTAAAANAVPGAAYWAGVDLGNMSGRMLRRAGVKHSGEPDMSDADAFVPPPWVRRLVYIQDGDSDPDMTRAKLLCGLRRAMEIREGLKAQIVHAGDGVDLNDLL